MCGKHLLLQQKNVKPDGAAIPYSGFYFSFLKMHKYAMVTLVRKLRQLNRFCFACISAILNLKQICPKMDFCQQQEYLPNTHKTDKLYLHI